MGIGDWLILGAVVILVLLVLRYLWYHKNSCSSCSGGCPGCSREFNCDQRKKGSREE